MNICIVTLYKSLNSGSFLQAYALKRYFETTNNNVFFLKINYSLKTRLKSQIKYPLIFIKNGKSEWIFRRNVFK